MRIDGATAAPATDVPAGTELIADGSDPELTFSTAARLALLPVERIGVVTQDGDRYVGHCEEVGTTSVGQTVAEAFANLQVATWHRLAERSGGADGPGLERA